uniref:Uncharacterized protein n=1 Tax=Ficus carica TaxID=3494 RepID=A0AA88E4P0_FICCA|nr:hypothetical protein TIFTF001_036975 [Ficus carica]GMN67928.1 hypothetical protein TIFTF001_036989 [Ficus carica]
MMLSKFSRVVPTCNEGGFGPWFELDWAGRPNHSMNARHGTYTHVMCNAPTYNIYVGG